MIESDKNKDKKIARKMLLELDNSRYENKVILELGRLDMFEKNYANAEKLFKTLIDTEEEEYALYQLAVLEGRQQRYANAYKLYENLLETSQREYALKKLIFLDIREKDYDVAYDHFQEINNQSIKEHLIDTMFYLKYQLGILGNADGCKSYYCMQVINYDEKRAIEHIMNHLYENKDKRKHTQFDTNVDINELFNEVKVKLQYEKVTSFQLNDYYLLDCDYPIGTADGIKTTKIKVVTLPNTKQIITMYPVVSSDKYDNRSYNFDDIDEVDLEETTEIEKPAVKQKTRLSQIEKFNKRYGNNQN